MILRLVQYDHPFEMVEDNRQHDCATLAHRQEVNFFVIRPIFQFDLDIVLNTGRKERRSRLLTQRIAKAQRALLSYFQRRRYRSD